MVLSELEALYAALATPLGIVIRTSDFKLAQNRLYAARRNAADPALDVLQFRRSSFSEYDLWIVNSGTKQLQPVPSSEASDTSTD